MPLADQIGFFDIIIAVICLIFLARGLWIGFVRQLATIVAVFCGFYAAGHYFEVINTLVLPFIDNRQLAFVVTYLVLLLLIYVGGMLLGLVLQKVMTITLLTWFDRTLGGLFGLAKGFFISCLVFMAMASFLSGTNSFLQKSLSYPVMKASSEALLAAVQDKELRSIFLPKEPAIRPEALAPVEQPEADRVFPPIATPQEAPAKTLEGTPGEKKEKAPQDRNEKVSL